jgi:hypothetical protein
MARSLPSGSVSSPGSTSSIDDRSAVAIAVVVAGGLLSPLPGMPGVLLALVLIVAARWFAGPDLTRSQGWAESLGLALLLALLVRALAGLLIATPAMLVALPLGLAAIGLAPRIASPRGRGLAAIGLAALLIGGGALGLAIERAGPTPRGMVHSGPLLGVHPRQAVAVTIDGFGPHDVIADDHVEPVEGVRGHGPASWAERLETELHAIAELHYAEGPARAREAFGRAEVDLADPIVLPGERALHEAVIGVEIRSGTTGEGSRVEFGCPGAVIDPRVDRGSAPNADCPRKYARDGSTGLGLSPRWPGYTELRGRDRLRIARWLGWPHGDAASDRRALAIELGLLSLALVVAMLVMARRSASVPGGSEAAMLGSFALFAVALVRPGALAGPLAATDVGMLIPLAAWLAMVGRPREGTRVDARTLMIVGLILALGLSPLAGRAGVRGLEAGLVELLVIDVGASWAVAGVVAATLAMLAIAPGTLACARALLHAQPARAGNGPSSAIRRAILAVAIGLGLILRKPGDDPALLAGATALVLACWLPADLPPWRRRAAAVVLALAAGFPLLGPGPRDPVVVGLVAGLALLGLVVGSLSARPRLEP